MRIEDLQCPVAIRDAQIAGGIKGDPPGNHRVTRPEEAAETVGSIGGRGGLGLVGGGDEVAVPQTQDGPGEVQIRGAIGHGQIVRSNGERSRQDEEAHIRGSREITGIAGLTGLHRNGAGSVQHEVATAEAGGSGQHVESHRQTAGGARHKWHWRRAIHRVRQGEIDRLEGGQHDLGDTPGGGGVIGKIGRCKQHVQGVGTDRQHGSGGRGVNITSGHTRTGIQLRGTKGRGIADRGGNAPGQQGCLGRHAQSEIHGRGGMINRTARLVGLKHDRTHPGDDHEVVGNCRWAGEHGILYRQAGGCAGPGGKRGVAEMM